MQSEYDSAATIYDTILFPFLQPIRKAVARELLTFKGKKLLDLCCGTGNQLKYLASQGYTDLHGLDLSKPMLEIGQKSHTPIHWYEENAAQTSFENATFDVITSTLALHEKDRVVQEAILAETYRILKDNGTLLLVDFILDNKSSWLAHKAIPIVERMAGLEHFTNFKSFRTARGLVGLIDPDQFQERESNRMLFRGIVLIRYQKM